MKYLFIFFFILFPIKAFSATCEIGTYAAFETTLSDPPYLICFNSCQFDVYNMAQKTGGKWDLFSKMNGKTCSSNTNLEGGYTPEEPEPPKDTILKCTGDYCNNPNNLQCPPNYSTGSFNNKRICYRNGKDPNENPDSKPEEENDGDLVCNETVEADGHDCQIINAIHNAKDGIGNSINNASNGNSEQNNSINETLKEIAEKLSKISSGGNGNGNGSNEDGGDNDEGLGEVDTSPLEATTPFYDTDAMSLNQNVFYSNASCPPDSELSFNFLGRPFSHSFSYQPLCDSFQVLGYFILCFAYLLGAYIVVKA